MNTEKNNEKVASLKLTNVRKVYGSEENAVEALKGINVIFRKNEFVSILGPSGCGKTTLLNIIGGLDRYTQGDLIIDGRSTKNYKDKDWDAYRNNSIGFVFQSYNLIPHQTVCANVELALELSGISKKERKEKALAILEKVGLKGQENKKPNQLSGGQMQRVAIARALINDPEIILADEPTGALDTETSIQVLDLLKEVAKDRLVIMVTHNPDLAEKYSTRIIKLVDGLVVDDSDPFEDTEKPTPKQIRKPKMGLKTAFMLSLRNLFSKKTRTLLVSIAGSIGIFGIALVLALSNGFSAYMSRMQTDSLASYPVTISESSVDLSSFTEIYETDLKETYPQLDNVFVHEAFKNLVGMLKNNKLDDTTENGFLHYLSQADKDLYYTMQYKYGFDINDYLFTNSTVNNAQDFSSINTVVDKIGVAFEEKVDQAMGGMLSTGMIASYIPTTQEMPDKELIQEQYELLHGKWPTFSADGYNQVVLVVDQHNGVSDITMLLLGYISGSYNTETNEFAFDMPKEGIDLSKIVGSDAKKLYLATNQAMYTKVTDGVYSANQLTKESSGVTEIEVVGIIRPKENVSGVLKTGIAYTSQLTQKILEQNVESAIVADAKASQHGAITIMRGTSPSFLTTRGLAGVNTPSSISIFVKDFDSKQLIKSYIDDWNARYTEDDEEYIYYSDMMSDMFGMMETMVDAVTYVLIAFSSISLVVSSVMIGIITYISVVERTKEIGVLRALGAAKGEVSNVFNVETFLIGLFAGALGIGGTYLVSIPVNMLLGSLIPSIGNLASLNPVAALLLVGISIILTLISGLIPAGVAAKKEPVNALRSE